MTPAKDITDIKVGIDFGDGVIPIGQLAYRDLKTYFEYDPAFIDRGLEISPYILPLQTDIFTFEDLSVFEGLPGVFNDSLPDGWGRLLMKRHLGFLTPFQMLAHTGSHGMGALVYEPDHSGSEKIEGFTIDNLAGQISKFVEGESSDVLAELINLGGSSGGARPQARIGVNAARDYIIHAGSDLPEGYESWLVKFPNTNDGTDAGAMEYVYGLMARDAGIEMPDIHLFPAEDNPGYFAVKLFDRDGKRRYHMHTACGLLHSDFRLPALDYKTLVRHTQDLTRDTREVEKLYRLAVFNVLAHNRDDHSKNFSFLMGADGRWRFSPAYDLTFCEGPGGEQSTTVMGEGRNPGIEHLTKLGKIAGIGATDIKQTIERVQDSFAHWPTLATEHGVSRETIKLVSDAWKR